MGGAAGEVAGDLVGEIEMRQSQGMYGGMGMDGPLMPGPRVNSPT